MNAFKFRSIRDGLKYQAEYRLSHWAGYKTIRNAKGDPELFQTHQEAEIRAATELCREMNSNPSFWHGPDTTASRTAAESLFKTRDDNGESTNQSTASWQASEAGQ